MISALFLFASALISDLQPVMTNLIEIETQRRETPFVHRKFAVRAPVIARLDTNPGTLLLGDENGVAQFRHIPSPADQIIACGDIVDVSGDFVPTEHGLSYAVCRKVAVIGRSAPPAPHPLTTSEFLSGKFDYRLSKISGTVKDVFSDEIDPHYTFLVLLSDNETIYVACRLYSSVFFGRNALIGKVITVEGIPQNENSVNRLHLGRFFYAPEPTKLHVLHSPAIDVAQIPELHNILRMRPQDISRLGRHKTAGTVLAIMHDRSFLIRTTENLIVRVSLGEGSPPKIGESVEVIGFPESNLYHLDLIRSSCHPSKSISHREDQPTDINPASISYMTNGHHIVNSKYHGKLVRIRGTVLSLPESGNADGSLRLDCPNQIVAVDIGTLMLDGLNISRGCFVEISGICVLDIETWRPNAAFPRIRGFSIVPRSSSDIRILSSPPWWTPRRLLILLCILVPVILVSVALNLILRRIVERRSRALLKEQSAKLFETLRVDERTRLAAELHDSVAQDLTGIAMQIETAEDLAINASDKLRHILSIASHALLNCREELRNCLWDLRSQALDEQNMGNAIARTLKPHLEDIDLALRFNVPRAVVSDATAHATLQIIRELTANAIRHGHAKHLRICGSIEGKHILFSVADDGCGFDPGNTPGVSQGHFGLSGIRERIRKLGGTINIQSSPGNGTKITVTL